MLAKGARARRHVRRQGDLVSAAALYEESLGI